MSNDDENNIPPPEEPVNPPTLESSSEEKPQSFSFDEAALEDPEDAELNRRGASIGRGSGKALTFGIILVLGTASILYYLFSDSPPPPKPAETGAKPPINVSREPIAVPGSGAPVGSVAPAPPLPVTPPAPPPPPPPPPPPNIPLKPTNVSAAVQPPQPPKPLAPPDIKAIATPAQTQVLDKRAATRMRSNMLLINGAKTADPDSKKAAQNAINQNDPNAEFASNAIAASDADTTTATKLSNLNTLIAQGKIVNAVLETAINTDLPGTLRAIISRDVYAEAGRDVLIPKGSRLIGTYNTGILRGQKRVLIVWTRVITPEGLDIAIGSPGVDSLGRSGMEGMVDNKFMESFSAAILTSAISLGVGIAADSTINGSGSSTTNTDGSTTSSGSAGASAANGAANAVGAVGKNIVGSLLDLRPTITVDQGTRINVFVNKDLIIPPHASGGGMFVQ